MFTKKTFLAAAAVAVMGAGTMGAGLAQPGPGGPGGWHHGPGLLEGVTLTDDQKSKLDALMKASHADLRSLHEQMHAIREKIDSTLLSSGDVTATTLAPLVQQQEALMQQLDAKQLSDEIAIRNMLTAAQIAQASSAHAELVSLHAQERALRQSQGAPPDQPE